MAEIKPSKNYVLGEYLGKYEAEPLEEPETPTVETQDQPYEISMEKRASETSLVKLEDGTFVLLPCYFSAYATPIPGVILIRKEEIIAEVSGADLMGNIETPEEETQEGEIDLETDEDLMNV